MRYISLALYAEGPTDHFFLRPLLRRVVWQVCWEYGNEPIELPEGFVELGRATLEVTGRRDRIIHLASRAADAITLLFVHADGARDPQAALTYNVMPAKRQLRAAMPDLAVVSVIPVFETEAWVLSDVDALARALGRETLPGNYAERLGKPDELEDPKGLLNELASARRENDIVGVMNLVGQNARLELLRRLSQFRAMELCLKSELTRVAVLPSTR